MRVKLCILLFLLSRCISAYTQSNIDSLRAIIEKKKGDVIEVEALWYLSSLHTKIDSAIKYAQQGLALSKQIKYKKGEADCLLVLAGIYGSSKNMIQAIQYSFSALSVYNEINDTQGIVNSHFFLEANYREAGDFRSSLTHALLGERIAEANNVFGTKVFWPGHRLSPLLLAEIGQTYLLMNQLDSALFYTKKSIAKNELFNGTSWGFPVYLLATVQNLQGNYKSAISNYHLSIKLSVKNGHLTDTLQNFSGMSTLFNRTGNVDSAIYYAQIVKQIWSPKSELKTLIEAVTNLGQAYKVKGNLDSAVKYIELSHTLKDSILSIEKDREVQKIALNEKQKQKDFIAKQKEYESKIKLFIVLGGLGVFLLITIILFRNNLLRKRAYAILKQQKLETDVQKKKVEQSLGELRSAQAQLIQSEKMASLGELTAGIAHEIQNPLNFVNNFSEVSSELVSELNTEIEKGNTNDAKEIASDLKQNLDKINYHGKRAADIVKGMLQHSRTSSGQKELTDINALADEYLRLTYHGLRAKDKTFNAKFETHLDPTLPKINVIPQEIGRVLLNLINNAFYAVNERNKRETADVKSEPSHVSRLTSHYEPLVTVSTKFLHNKIQISVKDNGNGIPESIKEKIFQPFFTTKPTGQGTGLGLSLSYDIITKGHDGEIIVKSNENEGSEFIIKLPYH